MIPGKWLTYYREATAQTKVFIWTSIVYGIATIATTVYCYGRLDFVRSYKTPTPPITKMEKALTFKK